jgi:RNA polymerase sigma factor (sigma-70 family)
MEHSDEALMTAVRTGNVTKLAALFERHHRRLFDFFCRLTGSRTVAEDLVQDVFFRILKYRASYDDSCSFTTWMFRIARNVRIDYFNKHRPDAFVASTDYDAASTAPSPSRELEDKQTSALLKQALLELPDEKRELLVLARYQEMSYVDIAALLDTDVGVVKVRVHRAIKELREVFLRISGENESCNAKNSEDRLRII